MPTVHIIIKGKVQGVFYRATAKKTADELGLKGWVKNKDDGAVELLISGPQESINKMVTWCKAGPKGAAVSSVQATPVNEEMFSAFSIIR